MVQIWALYQYIYKVHRVFYANRPSWRFIKSSIHPSFFPPMNTVTPPLHYYKEKAEQIKLILDIMIWFAEYEVTSSVISPNGHAVSVVTTNQTHTAVENLKPESRYTHWTLDCVCLSPTHRIFHYTTDSSFFSCFFFLSYEFTVTPKNELGSGPSSEPVSFSTESGMKNSLEPSLLHLLSILSFSIGPLAKASLSKSNHKTALRFMNSLQILQGKVFDCKLNCTRCVSIQHAILHCNPG